MNVSEQGLSNAHFNIPNGCLTKKLQPFKDDSKIRNFRKNHSILGENPPFSAKGPHLYSALAPMEWRTFARNETHF